MQNKISDGVSEPFSLWKVVLFVKHADLGVIDPVGPLRSVTVKLADVSCLAYNMGEALPRAAVFTDSADFGRFCQISPDLRGSE